MDTEALVFVVDDDASLRASLQDLLGSVGLRVAAFADDTVRARALAAGAVAVLSKPCREEDLLHAIEAALTPS